jgi:crossover junction endodeoxyribonuclease RuvC
VIIIALDLSLTGTGIARVNSESVRAETVKCPKLLGNERLHFILDRCIRAGVPGADLFVIEGAAYGQQGGQRGHHERAGLWWLVAHSLWCANIPYVVVTPSARAKYATGRGNAPKAEVMAAAIRRYGHLVEMADDNQCDAVILGAMAADHYGQPLAKVPALNVTALDKVEWPELEGMKNGNLPAVS